MIAVVIYMFCIWFNMLVIYSNAYGLYAGNYSDAFGFNAWYLKKRVLNMALLQNGFKLH